MGAERENIGRMGTSPNGNVTIENMLACMPIISILLRGPNCALKVNDHGYRDNFEIALHFCDFKHANEGQIVAFGLMPRIVGIGCRFTYEPPLTRGHSQHILRTEGDRNWFASELLLDKSFILGLRVFCVNVHGNIFPESANVHINIP